MRMFDWLMSFFYREECSFCGRDLNALYHDGWNGYFVDENLTCRGR